VVNEEVRILKNDGTLYSEVSTTISMTKYGLNVLSVQTTDPLIIHTWPLYGSLKTDTSISRHGAHTYSHKILFGADLDVATYNVFKREMEGVIRSVTVNSGLMTAAQI
jgi:hypothetical protein